jgi:MoaA/NifB/PqqE/SkfB family radical SAM enzyme
MMSTESTGIGIENGFRRLVHYLIVAVGGLGMSGSKALLGPLHAQIALSDPCNHRCVMCWDHPPADRENESTSPSARFGQEPQLLMSFPIFKSAIDDLHTLGNRRIELAGRGEPFLNPTAIDMIAYAKESGFEVQIVTNGSLLTQEISRRLVKVKTENLKVSLNAGTPETYPAIHVTETPENYNNVKCNLRTLVDEKEAAGATLPHIQLSFILGSKNYKEVEKMVEVCHEVGAQEAIFVQTVTHKDTQDLSLTVEQLDELKTIILSAKVKAKKLGVQTNLDNLGESIPGYMVQKVVGPSVVPCYAGWYFTLILANGSVLFCCQCSTPVDKITEKRRFIDIWKSRGYQSTRKAARKLPEKNPLLETCECDQCQLRPRNISIHNFIQPWNKINSGNEVRRYSLVDILRKWKGDYT